MSAKELHWREFRMEPASPSLILARQSQIFGLVRSDFLSWFSMKQKTGVLNLDGQAALYSVATSDSFWDATIPAARDSVHCHNQNDPTASASRAGTASPLWPEALSGT